MGSNATQARGVSTFLMSFVLIAAGLAGPKVLILTGLLGLGLAAAIFLRCKPWEHAEE